MASIQVGTWTDDSLARNLLAEMILGRSLSSERTAIRQLEAVLVLLNRSGPMWSTPKGSMLSIQHI